MANESVYFYGRFASAPKRELERLARERGFRVAASLNETLDVVVLGEDESIGDARARLALEFDERSRLAFERGALVIVSESSFLAGLRESESGRAKEATGLTPAAVAELVGVTVVAIRRWLQRGFLKPFYRGDRLPLLAPREIAVARRLAFLTSTGLSDDFIAKRVVAFANLDWERRFKERQSSSQRFDEPPLLFDFHSSAPESVIPSPSYDASLADKLASAPFDVGAILLKTTLASDGKDVLFFGDEKASLPVDYRGQRRFEFAAAPTDGAYETPASAPLSEDEAQMALADRLRDWNSAATSETGRPAFLSLFSGDAESEAFAESGSPSSSSSSLADLIGLKDEPVSTSLDAYSDGRTRSFLLSKEARARIREVAGRKLIDLCEDAWNLEREGYWEEAARVYRAAALAGGAEASVCYRLGKVLFLLGDYSAARERFFTALELDEDFVDARIELGKTFVALGELEDAYACFQGALVDRPADSSLCYEFGKLCFQLNRRDEAQDALQRALENAKDPKLIEEIKKTSLEITIGVI